jgi:hypothetical protein
LWMKVHVSVPWTEWVGSAAHVYPWNNLPISLHMANCQRAPAEELLNSLYSACRPVSGLIAVKHPGSNLVGAWLGRVLLRGPSAGGTPRSVAGSEWCCFPFGARCWGCWRISARRMSSPRWVGSMVLTNVSVGGVWRIVIKSSTVARSRSVLVSLGKGLCGNHVSWFTILSWRVSVAQTW